MQDDVCQSIRITFSLIVFNKNVKSLAGKSQFFDI